MTDVDPRRSWTQLRRFEFLEWKMFWEGRVIRSDLEATFGISTPQASVDLRNYREILPDNMEATARGYRPSPSFKPRFLKLSADRLLLQLRAFLAGVISREDLWFKELPPMDTAPDIIRNVSPDCLRPFLEAIRTRAAIQIRYHALSGTRSRAIAPHALVFDGHRWHVRAWSCDKQDFRDFLLSRIDQVGESFPVSFDPAEDREWETRVQLQLRPHSGLTPEQRHAIQLDYGMEDGRLNIEMRASLAFYFIRRMNLDLDTTEVLTPQRLQIELENLAEVNAQIAGARAESEALVAKRLAAAAESSEE